MLSFLNLVLSLLVSATLAIAANRLPYATVASGVLIGTTTSLPSATATVNKFLGVPFAASPVRFLPPTAATAWPRPLVAKEWKPSCIQQFNYPEASRNLSMFVFNNPPPIESEDCLYLNVYAPSGSPPLGGFPVMVWIYGGGLSWGNAGQSVYDGSSFAAYQDVIIVAANYRTNIFGFPSSPELALNRHNLGLLDQHFALEWVQDNIRAFKGNPQKVTIFGESAGGYSVDALVNSWTRDPPFRAAITQSGQQYLGVLQNLGSNLTDNWYTVAQALNCSEAISSLACLRNVPASALKSVIEQEALVFGPIVDDLTVIANPTAAKSAHNIANVSLLAGTVSEEARVFVYGQTNLTAILNLFFPGQEAYQKTVAEAYALGTEKIVTTFDAIAAIYTDYIFDCLQSKQIKETAAAGYPTWHYYYDASFPNIQVLPGLGVYHTSEIPMVFGNYPANFTAQQYALSQYMQGAWAAFAKNPTLGPGWNRVGTFDSFDVAVLGANGTSGATLVHASVADAKCELYAPIYSTVGI